MEPVWNDVLTLKVPQTAGASLIVEVWDSDKNTENKTLKVARVDDEILGVGRVLLEDLASSADVEVNLIDPKAKTKSQQAAGFVTLIATLL